MRSKYNIQKLIHAHPYHRSHSQLGTNGDERRVYRIVAPFTDAIDIEPVCPYTLDVAELSMGKRASIMRPVSSSIALRMPESFEPSMHPTPDWTQFCR